MTINEIHISSICRLGRNPLYVLTTLMYFNKNKIIYLMLSINDGKQNSVFTMIISVLANVSEIECDFRLERQKQDIIIAKASGTYKERLLGKMPVGWPF